MPQDRSLDEFVSAGSDADGGEPDVGEGPDGEADEPGDVTPSVEPMAATYAWSPDGGECAACGDSVDSRWRDGDELVCEACKDW